MWASLIPGLLQLGLPVLGQALGGPLASAAGQIIAGKLGTAVDPTAIGKVISDAIAQSNETIIQQLKSAEAQYIETVRADAAVAQTTMTVVGQTMRQELLERPATLWDWVQRGWRPVFAWELLLEMTAMAVITFHEIWTGDFKTLEAMMQFSGFLTWYFGMRFGVLGVVAAGRSAERVAAIKTVGNALTEDNVVTRAIKRVQQAL